MNRRARRRAAACLAVASAIALAGCAGEEKNVTVAVTVHTSTGGSSVPATATGGVPTDYSPTTAYTPTTPTTPTAPLYPTIPTVTSPTSPTTPGTTTDAQGPAGYPDAGERRLLDRLPTLTSRRCTRTNASDRDPRATVSLQCDLRDLYNVRTVIERFPSVAVADGVYERTRRTQGVGRSIGPCTRSGIRPPGETTWHTRGKKAPRGRVMCFRSDERFWFVWTQNDARVVVWASSARLPSVRQYWIDDSNIRPG